MVRHDDVEILILEDLLPKEYRTFASRVIPVSKQRIQEIKHSSQPGDIRDIVLKSIRDNACMRIKLRNSILLFIPESTQLLSRKLMYYEDRMSFAGFLATYIPDLNHFTLLHVLGSDRLAQFFSNKRFDTSRDIYQRLFPKTERLPEFSSLNFLLQHTATNTTRTEACERDHLNHCFEYAYWHMPTHNILEEYDSFHNFIYHSYHKIYEICDIFKTLIKIEKIDSVQHQLVFLKKPVKHRRATIKILMGGQSTTTLKQSLLIPEPLASQIQVGDIINGIIANCHKFNRNIHRLILINAVGRIIRDKPNLKILTTIAIHLYCKYELHKKHIESITVDELLSKIDDLLTTNEDFFGSSWNSTLSHDSVSASVMGLYPLLLNYDNTINIIPPALISYLSQRPKFLRMEYLYEIINLINLIPLSSDHTSRALGRANQSLIRKSNSYVALQKADKSNEICGTLFSDLPHLINYISYSKIISKSIL